MSRSRLRPPIHLLVTVLVPIVLAPGISAAQASPGCTPGWSTVPSPSPGQTGSSLEDVAVVSYRDAWAVGVAGGSPSRALVEHWNGTAWSIVPTPDPGGSTRFNGVFAQSSTDVWAVGSTSTLVEDPLIEHWDGSAWSIVSSAPTGSGVTLLDVAGTGPDDVWAVGTASPAGVLVEHWDGESWTSFPAPTGRDSFLYSVTAIAPGDAWAVGEDYRPAKGDAAIIEHWDGRSWTLVKGARSGRAKYLNGVWGASSNDVWAVGDVLTTPGKTHAEHWDGTRWTTVPTPTAPYASLAEVSGSSSDDVWAVGAVNENAAQTPDASVYRTVTEHWNGSSWKRWPSPNPATNDLLAGVAVESSGDAWAVGAAYDDLQQTLVLRFTSCRA